MKLLGIGYGLPGDDTQILARLCAGSDHAAADHAYQNLLNSPHAEVLRASAGQLHSEAKSIEYRTPAPDR